MSIQDLAINTIRTLSMDAVQAANSGHPGTPMALAPIAYTLFNETLKYDPEHPLWPGRDRFVLSCGHASMLLYSVLHLSGVKQAPEHGGQGELAVSLDSIKRFRQMHSRCPGHPEHGETSGVETTTGPLGQGAGNSVGMAAAQRWLAAHFNRPGFELFDYRIFVLASDGDLMEGVTAEAASLAGHLKLSNLCWIYDDNRITIEGETSLAFSEDVATRFQGYGWNVVRVAKVNDLGELRQAYAAFDNCDDRPTLVIVRSHIGYGSPNKVDTHNAHGSPLGDEEIKLTKQAYAWPPEEKFLVPPEVLQHFKQGIGARGAMQYADWQGKFLAYAKQHPELAEQWKLMEKGDLPAGWDAGIPTYPADAKGMASRISSGKVLNAIAGKVSWFIGGSADLAPSTMTLLEIPGAKGFGAGSYDGCNFHFGIREHAMASACNGMALSGLRPFCATFFIFSDYLRPSMRLAALMGLPVLYVFTHDSIGVGEDGPTHQPVEQLAAARSIPGLLTIRPADANEVAQAYRVALGNKKHPVALVLTRQNLPTVDRTKFGSAAGLAQGGYVLADADGGKPDVLLMATGSEVSLCLEAYEQLKNEGIKARVVSMPCFELFDQQPQEYRDQVLPPNVTSRVAVEAGVQQCWDRYLGLAGKFVGMSSFGASAPFAQLFKHFGLTKENVVAQAKASLGK